MGLLQPGFAKELRALPLMTHSLFEQWGRTGRLVLHRRSQGRGRGSGVLSTQLPKHDKTHPENADCGVWPFLWCKFSHYSQLRAANVLSLNAELGKRGASPSLGKHTAHQVTDLGFSSDLSSQSTEHVDVLHSSDF